MEDDENGTGSPYTDVPDSRNLQGHDGKTPFCDLRHLNERLDEVTAEIETLAKADHACQRLMTVPRIGPIIASAMVSAVGDGAAFGTATGRPAYHPSVLLKLYIYGYLNRVQSSRRLERERSPPG